MQKIERYFEYPQDTRWSTDEEIMSPASSLRIDVTKPPYESAGLILRSDGRTVYVDDQDHHSLILGTTGSGKSRLLCMPMLNVMAHAGESFIVTDPKGELYQTTSGLARSLDYKVIVLNFRDVAKGDMWNPLKIPYELYKSGKRDQALSMMNDLVMSLTASMDEREGTFWLQMAQSLLLANLLLLFESGAPDEINMRSLCRLCLDYGKKREENPIYELLNYMEPDSIAAMNYAGVCVDAERTQSSIMGVVHSVLRLFNSQEGLLSMMADSSFDLRRIGREKTAIYMIIPDEKSTYHFLVSMFTKQCYEMLIGEATKLENMFLPVRVNFVLDEFPNLPRIPDMPNMITAARSRNIRFHLVIQGLEQLKSKYGTDAVTITSNCENWIYLNSKEYECLEELSKRCGNLLDTHDHIRPLITASRLQRLNKEAGEALVFHGRLFPYITHLADISAYAFSHMDPVPLESIERKKASVFHVERLLCQLKNGDVPLLFSAGDEARKDSHNSAGHLHKRLGMKEIDQVLARLCEERIAVTKEAPVQGILYYLTESECDMEQVMESLSVFSKDFSGLVKGRTEESFRNSLRAFCASCELHEKGTDGWYGRQLKKLFKQSVASLTEVVFYPVDREKTEIVYLSMIRLLLDQVNEEDINKELCALVLTDRDALSDLCDMGELYKVLSNDSFTKREFYDALLTKPYVSSSPAFFYRKKMNRYQAEKESLMEEIRNEARRLKEK